MTLESLRAPLFEKTAFQKEIHFYSHAHYVDDKEQILISYDATVVAIVQGMPAIHTFQMSLMEGRLWELGYRIFVHDDTGVYELKLGTDNTRTHRELRISHNLFKMWKNGEFRL